MLDTKTQEMIKKIIFRYLDPKKNNVFIFGSRADNTARRFSDIDIGIEGKDRTSSTILSMIKADFDDSDIPYTVDVVDFLTTSINFKNIAKKNIISLN